MRIQDLLKYEDPNGGKNVDDWTHQPNNKPFHVQRLLTGLPAFKKVTKLPSEKYYILILPIDEAFKNWDEKKLKGALLLLNLIAKKFTPVYYVWHHALRPLNYQKLLKHLKENHFSVALPHITMAQKLNKNIDSLKVVTPTYLEELWKAHENNWSVDECNFVKTISLIDAPTTQAYFNQLLETSCITLKNLIIANCPVIELQREYLSISFLSLKEYQGKIPSTLLNLTILHLDKMQVNRDVARCFQFLVELIINDCKVDNDITNVYPEKFTRLERLEIIDTFNMQSLIGRLDYPIMTKFMLKNAVGTRTYLNQLLAQGCKLEVLEVHDSAQDIYNLAIMPMLKSLILPITNLNQFLRLLSQAKYLESVKWWKQGTSSIKLPDTLLDPLSLIHLYRLDLTDWPGTFEHLYQTILQYAPNLQTLALRTIKTDDSLQKFRTFPKLTKLSLYNAEIRRSSLQKILDATPLLQILTLSSSYCNDSLLNIHLPCLHELDLTNSGIKCEALMQLLMSTVYLKSLTLNNCTQLNEGRLTQVNAGHLYYLNMLHCSLKAESMQTLISAAINLEHLSVLNACETFDVQCLQQSSKLRKLTLCFQQIINTSNIPFHLTELTHMMIRGKFDAKIISSLIKNAQKLKSITLARSDDKVCFFDFSDYRLPLLRKLLLAGFDTRSIESLLHNHPLLTELTIQGIGSSVKIAFEKITLKSLYVLSITDCEISSHSLIHVMQNNPHMIRLSLRSVKTQITQALIQSLSQLKGLIFSYMKIAEADIESLLQQALYLRIISFDNCSLSNLFCNKIKSTYPNTAILFSSSDDKANDATVTSMPSAPQYMDANTTNTRTVKTCQRQFWGKKCHPALNLLRHDVIRDFKLNPNCSGDQNPFILQSSEPNLVPYSVPVTTTSLLDTFVTSHDDDHYFAQFPFYLSQQWQPLPSLSPRDQLLMLSIDSTEEIEVCYSANNCFYYIRRKNNAIPAGPVQIELLIKSPEARLKSANLPDELKMIYRYCYGFRDDELEVQTRTAEVYLKEIIKQRTGSCRHRALAFKHLTKEYDPTLPVQIISNRCDSLSPDGLHMFAEVFWQGEWITCDLGGYATDQIIHDPLAAKCQAEEEGKFQLTPADELFTMTYGKNGFKAPPSYFAQTCNLTTLKIEGKKRFPTGHFNNVENLEIQNTTFSVETFANLISQTPKLKTLKITHCHLSAETFINLNFSMLTQLEHVTLSGAFIPNQTALDIVMGRCQNDKIKWIINSTVPLSRDIRHAVPVVPLNTTATATATEIDTAAVTTPVIIHTAPRKIPANRYLPQEMNFTMVSLFSATWPTALIKTNDVDALRVKMEKELIKSKPCIYIHRPEELICSNPYLAKNERGEGVIKPQPGGAFYRFIQDNAAGWIILNLAQFNGAAIAQFNTILDEKRKVDGVVIPEAFQIIVLMNPNTANVYLGTDVYSRILTKATYTPVLKPLKTAKVLDQAPEGARCIELCGGDDWEAQLVGHWLLESKTFIFQEGELIEELNAGATIINLNNAPLQNTDFLRFLHDFELHHGVYHQHKLHLTVDRPIQFTFTANFAFKEKEKIFNFNTSDTFPPNPEVCNPDSLSEFLGSYVKDIHGGLVKKDGLIAKFAKKQLSIYLTQSLTEMDWLKLYKVATVHHTQLHITLAPAVILPDELRPQQPLSTFVCALQNHTEWHLHLPTHLPSKMLFVPVMDLEPSDLLDCIVNQFDKKTLELNFIDKPSFLSKALNAKQTVVLQGPWRKDMASALHRLIFKRLQTKNAKGKLILVSDEADTFSFIQPSQQNKTTCIEPVRIKPAYADRFIAVETILRDYPFVLLTGPTGSGKTYFAKKIWPQMHPHCHYGEDALLAWAVDNNPGLKILFIDEANMAKEWALFEGLFLASPCIIYQGEDYPLSKMHKVIFAANPLSYGGERRVPALLKKYTIEIEFAPIPTDEIEKQLVLTKETAAPILNLIETVTHYDANDTLIGPREMQMMATLTNATSHTHPQLAPAEVAKYFAYVLAQSHVTPAYRPDFDAQFAPTAHLEFPLPTLPGFIINDTNKPAVLAIMYHLNLRQLRCQQPGAVDPVAGLGGLILEGPPGVGKSDMVMLILQSLGLVENKDFIQIPASWDAELKIKHLKRAFRRGQIVVYDEMNCSTLMERCFNALLEGSDLNNCRGNQPGFLPLVSQNPALHYSGRIETTPPLLHRFQRIVLQNYTDQEAHQILLAKGVPAKIATDMIYEYQQKSDFCFRDLILNAKKWLEQYLGMPVIEITMKSQKQVGEVCKLTALANVEMHFSRQLGFTPFPLRAKGHNTVSIRSIAKHANDSVQGEVLKFDLWQKIACDLGYKAEVVTFAQNVALLTATIAASLMAGDLPLIAFAADPISKQPDPEASLVEEREHAAVITGFDPANDQVILTHWGNHYHHVELSTLWYANAILAETRTQEYYKRNPNYERNGLSRKYFLQKQSSERNSIIPEPNSNSGFRGKLLVIKKPDEKVIARKREQAQLTKADYLRLFSHRQTADQTKTTGIKCVRDLN